MGFRKVTDIDLKTKLGDSFMGVPIKHMGRLISKESIQQRRTSTSRSKYSEVVIDNEEALDIHYKANGEIKSFDGRGIISISNDSTRDRIWDARIRFSGTESSSLELENDVDLGIFEPKTTRSIRYNVSKLENLLDLIKIQEKIEIINNELNTSKELVEVPVSSGNKMNRILVIGQENEVKISITVENKSEADIEDLKLQKYFSNNFYDLDVKAKSNKEVNINNNLIEWTLTRLRPREQSQLTIIIKVFPKVKDDIRTGKIDVSFNLKDKVISGTQIDGFSAHSHAMHSINNTELEDTAGHWVSTLIFENHSTFLLKLNSILISDKSKKNKIIDLNFDASDDNALIRPGGVYLTNDWEVKEESNPRFTRKIDYTVFSTINKKTILDMTFEDEVFDIVGVDIEKNLSKKEIKSFEKSIIHSIINIKNIGSIPIEKLFIRETIPKDFIPLMDLADYKLKNSSGSIELKDINLKLIPDDDDSSKEHVLEMGFNNGDHPDNSAIDLNDFLEVEYPVRAINPDHNSKYAFPTEIETQYSMFKDHFKEIGKDFYIKIDKLLEHDIPTMKVTHERRNLSIGKQILAGRTNDEFSINIYVVNNSNVKIHDLEISDTFPESFQFVSSNIKNKITENNEDRTRTIVFALDSILPLEEKEIIYYLKDNNGHNKSYSELESFFYG